MNTPARTTRPDTGAVRTRLLAGLLLCATALCSTAARAAQDPQDYSPAERLLFMSPQLGGLQAPLTLRYAFRKTGTLETPFDDSVSVVFSAQADGACCAARGEFLSGARRLPLPDVESAVGNPVIMYFLERDVREMQRLTQGSQNHFRQRIRRAVYDAAAVRDVELVYRGRVIGGQEVAFTPYLADPNRPRFEQYAGKEYRFLLSGAVPGGVFAIRTRIAGAAASAAPLIAEELYLEGAQPVAPQTAP